MNEETRQYWKAVCIERCMYSLEEGSRSSTTEMGQLVGFLSYREAHLYVTWNRFYSIVTFIMWTTSAFLLKRFQETAGVFHIIGIMRRLADYYLNKAPTLDEMKKAHRKFVHDYNRQIHFAHQKRRDNRHSPHDVLRGVLARTVPEPILARIFFATQFTRHLDRSGYIRFRRWRFYAAAGLASQKVQVHIYSSTLKVAYEETDLAFYTVAWHEDNKHITAVSHARLVETSYRSPQLMLWILGPDEWLLFKKLPDYAPRTRRRRVDVIQLPLPDIDEHKPQGASS